MKECVDRSVQWPAPLGRVLERQSVRSIRSSRSPPGRHRPLRKDRTAVRERGRRERGAAPAFRISSARRAARSRANSSRA